MPLCRQVGTNNMLRATSTFILDLCILYSIWKHWKNNFQKSHGKHPVSSFLHLSECLLKKTNMAKWDLMSGPLSPVSCLWQCSVPAASVERARNNVVGTHRRNLLLPPVEVGLWLRGECLYLFRNQGITRGQSFFMAMEIMSWIEKNLLPFKTAHVKDTGKRKRESCGPPPSPLLAQKELCTC